MSKSRASIFGEEEVPALDVTGFAPKAEIDQKAPPAEQVRAVSQAANFKSREGPATKAIAKSSKRQPRQYRTGRNVQLSIKALAETVEALLQSLGVGVKMG
jgi:hypothetical protein